MESRHIPALFQSCDKQTQKSMESNSIIVTGDINFVSTDWKTMHSSNEHENDCLNDCLNLRDLTVKNKQLGVFFW